MIQPYEELKVFFAYPPPNCKATRMSLYVCGENWHDLATKLFSKVKKGSALSLCISIWDDKITDKQRKLFFALINIFYTSGVHSYSTEKEVRDYFLVTYARAKEVNGKRQGWDELTGQQGHMAIDGVIKECLSNGLDIDSYVIKNQDIKNKNLVKEIFEGEEVEGKNYES